MIIDFKYGFDSIYTVQRQMHFAITNANICDTNGNLLFYTNGHWIANVTGDTMQNGNNLIHNAWTQDDTIGEYSEQGALILPMPGDNNKYYLFHGPKSNGFQEDWFYSIIDMNLDSGFGAVVSFNNTLIHDSLVRGKITACKHANGRDWWIVFPRYNSQIYYKFLITPYGILGPYTQNAGGSVRFTGRMGQACFSRDGLKYAYYDGDSDLDIFDFDRCTGDFTNLIHVDIYDSADIGGVAFSPNNKLLYVSSNTFVYQFDLASGNIPQSQLTVAVWDSSFSPSPPLATTFFLAWLAPDDKIYIVCGNSTIDMHRINNPDSVGLGCDVAQHSVHLPTYNAFTIPQNVNYFLGADTLSVLCDTINHIENKIYPGSRSFAYPNPAISEITLHYILPDHKQSFVKIYNSSMQLMKTGLLQSSGENQIHLEYFAAGLYFYYILQESIVVSSGKFSVIK